MWAFLLVPSGGDEPFADLRTVQEAMTSLAQGFDPQLVNPGEARPRARVMNDHFEIREPRCTVDQG